ncbi:MAG: ABC transporter substrate-binding protein [Halanaerobiales bacterium]|nr:ABC transporter substrate-binding protein [Halanaerobiales bacterium]
MKKILSILFVFTLVFSLMFIFNTVKAEEVEVTWWHAMSGGRLEPVKQLVEEFNQSHPDITVNATFTGSYQETLNKAITAAKAGNPPNIIQTYEVGTQMMWDSPYVVPIEDLAEPGEVDWGDYLSVVRRYYTNPEGKLVSMPFNSSTAILYYNKDMFKKAGLDPLNPPSSYAELGKMGRQLIDTETVEKAITFGWPTWVFEQTHYWTDNNYVNNGNGREKRATEVLFNQEPGMKIMQTWADWEENDILIYGGREYEPDAAFISQNTAMLVQSTSHLKDIIETAPFEVGTTFLPRPEWGNRGGTTIGGASLYIFKDNQEKMDAAWKFVKWLSNTDNAVFWHKETGYFPIRYSALTKLMNQGWFSEHPSYLTAFIQVLTAKESNATSGAIVGRFPQIRDIVDEAVTSIFGGQATVEEALNNAAEEANQVIEQYNESQ